MALRKRFIKRRRRVAGRSGYGSRARVSSRARSVRYTMRRGGRRPPNIRTMNRSSTRTLAKRAFVTRGGISVTEYRHDTAPAITCAAQLDGVSGVYQRFNRRWASLASAPNVQYDGFDHNSYGRFVELLPGYNGDPAMCSPIFNCYPGSTAIPDDTNFIRVLRHSAFLTLRIEPFNFNSESSGPLLDRSRPVHPLYPQRLHARIVGVRVDSSVFADPDGIGNLGPGEVAVHLPAYVPRGFGNPWSFDTNSVKNMLDPTATLATANEEDYLLARAPDYNDRHSLDRRLGRKIVYDKVFTFNYPYAFDDTTATKGVAEVNPSYRHGKGFMRRLRIDLPPHTVRFLGETEPYTTPYHRQVQYRFYMCVKQSGFPGILDSAIKPEGRNQPAPS